MIDYKNVTVEIKIEIYKGKKYFVATVQEDRNILGQGKTVEEAYNDAIGNYKAIVELENRLVLESAFKKACKALIKDDGSMIMRFVDGQQIHNSNEAEAYFIDQAEKELKEHK